MRFAYCNQCGARVLPARERTTKCFDTSGTGLVSVATGRTLYACSVACSEKIDERTAVERAKRPAAKNETGWGYFDERSPKA